MAPTVTRNMLGQRAGNTVYQNTTNTFRVVYVTTQVPDSYGWIRQTATVDGIEIIRDYVDTQSYTSTASVVFVVPPGSYYSVWWYGYLLKWVELSTVDSED